MDFPPGSTCFKYCLFAAVGSLTLDLIHGHGYFLKLTWDMEKKKHHIAEMITKK